MFRSICFILPFIKFWEIRFLEIFKNYFKKKIDLNNRELKEVLNGRYRKIKKLGAGAQGTVYEIEDLNQNLIK